MQVIGIGLNSYFIKGSEIVNSNLETIESTLSQTEIDQILSLSLKERVKNTDNQCLHFMINGTKVILEKITCLETEELFRVTLPDNVKMSWPLTLRGIVSSQGIVTAPCIHQEVLDLTSAIGKILISSHLNIKDVKSLKGIKGIILKNGSLMSHVGILTREKQIPCLMGVKGADLIPNGATIKLDAFSGMITPVT